MTLPRRILHCSGAPACQHCAWLCAMPACAACCCSATSASACDTCNMVLADCARQALHELRLLLLQIGESVQIDGPTVIRDSFVGDGSHIRSFSVLEGAQVHSPVAS